MELVKQREEFCRTYDEQGSSEQLNSVQYKVVHEGQQVGDVNVSSSGFYVNANCMSQFAIADLSAGVERMFAAFDASVTATQAKVGSK